MEQVEFNNIQDTKFSNYFTDIESLRKEDLTHINTLIQKYPYCQALHLLAARSAVGTSSYEQTLANAAVSVPSRTILYNFIHKPSKFKSYKLKKENRVHIIEETDRLISIIDDKEKKTESLGKSESFIEDEVFEEITPSVKPEETLISIHQQPLSEIDEIENLSLDGEKYSEFIVDEFSNSCAAEEKIEEEIIAVADEEIKQEVSEGEIEEEIEEQVTSENEIISEEVKDTALPYIENIQEEEDIDSSEVKKELVQENLPIKNEPVNLTRYNDERLPYTFLWWLSKTRKTYQENLRPYATFSLDTTQEIKRTEPDPLEHQIAENIFHINSLADIQNQGPTSTVAFDFMRKEHQIIEKFIKEEPQIKPPVANKIDTENKAKKSSEDKNELVSETLAKIYVEQMLFHKALDVYKKLSLKYPEKSAYFASQIKYLELKVN